MNGARFIVLNGGSSAGKSTLTKAFQHYALARHGEIFIHFGIDSFFYLMPESIGHRQFHHVRETLFSIKEYGLHNNPYPVFQHTEKGNRVVRARYQSIRCYLDNGFSVIGDEQFWEQQWQHDLLEHFEDHEVLLAKVYAQKKKVKKREAQRETARLEGLCLSSYDYAHRNMSYDISLDTTSTPGRVLAEQLYQCYVDDRYSALAALRRTLNA